MKGDFFGNNAVKVKQVITYAADIIVYINGMATKMMIPINNANSRANLQDDIVSCNLSLGIDNAGGNTANLSFVVPRHSNKQYFKFGKPILRPMMEVEIFMKGRFLDSNGAPQYYQTFWGVIVDVNVDYSGGQQTMEVSCLDILYFWSITSVNTRPSVFNLAWDPAAQMTEYISIFNHLTPFEIMIALSYVMTGTLSPPAVSLATQSSSYTRAFFTEENTRMMLYWDRRSLAIGKRLKMFGFAGGTDGPDILFGTLGQFDQKKVKEIAEKIEKIFPRSGRTSALTVWEAMGRSQYSTKEDVTKQNGKLDGSVFNTFFPWNATGNNADLDGGEMQNRLELANQVKDIIGYEFFMDVNGEIIFKPPFYNLDVRYNDPVSVIRDVDIVNFSFSESTREIATRMDVRGTYSTYFEDGDKNSLPYGAYTDYVLARDYGVKSVELTRNFLYSSDLCLVYAIAELSKHNAKRFTSNLTIVGRPELHLGYPIYIESSDMFMYVTQIAHSYSATGKMETTLSLEAARRKHLKINENSKDPKFGRVIAGAEYDDPESLRKKMRGVPNMVLIADIPSSFEEVELHINKGETAEAFDKRVQTAKKAQEEITKSGALYQKQLAGAAYYVPPGGINTDTTSNNIVKLAGSFVGQKFQTFGRVMEVQKAGVLHADLTQIPISDEWGYEVVGGFGYGRGVYLLPNNVLKPSLQVTEQRTWALQNPPPDPKKADSKLAEPKVDPKSLDGQKNVFEGFKGPQSPVKKTLKTNSNTGGITQKKQSVSNNPEAKKPTNKPETKPSSTADKKLEEKKTDPQPQQFTNKDDALKNAKDGQQAVEQILSISLLPERPVDLKTAFDASETDHVFPHLAYTPGKATAQEGVGVYLSDLSALNIGGSEFNSALDAETTAAIEASKLVNTKVVYDQVKELGLFNAPKVELLGYENQGLKSGKTADVTPNKNDPKDGPQTTPGAKVSGAQTPFVIKNTGKDGMLKPVSSIYSKETTQVSLTTSGTGGNKSSLVIPKNAKDGASPFVFISDTDVSASPGFKQVVESSGQVVLSTNSANLKESQTSANSIAQTNKVSFGQSVIAGSGSNAAQVISNYSAGKSQYKSAIIANPTEKDITTILNLVQKDPSLKFYVLDTAGLSSTVNGKKLQQALGSSQYLDSKRAGTSTTDLPAKMAKIASTL